MIIKIEVLYGFLGNKQFNIKVNKSVQIFGGFFILKKVVVLYG